MLTILRYPHRSLRAPAKPVTAEQLPTLPLSSLLLSLKELNAVGIAANQIGDPRSYCIVGIPDREPFLMVNPFIVEKQDQNGFEDEGCLSLPGITVSVLRPLTVKVRWLDEGGGEQEEVFGGLAARIVCHELEHLRGGLILDHLSLLKRRKLKSYIDKALRMEKANLKYALRYYGLK